MRTLIPAAFYRGGTSKAVLFNRTDLPANRRSWEALFCHVLGSPDAYGRQLDGMGGGLSSLSKVAVVDRSEVPGVDLDYTFVQIAVDQPLADYGAMCGNIASAVGPFAVTSGQVKRADGQVTLTIRNTNTNKIFRAGFEVRDGQVVEQGDLAIAGVSGTGAPVGLSFLDPAGATTGQLLPTGQPRDWLALPTGEIIEASMVDATNPVVFVRAADLGKTGYEHPDALEKESALMAQLEAVRRAGAVAMGLSARIEDAAAANPKVAMVAAPGDFTSLDGVSHPGLSHDVSVRMVSMGRIHRAVTLTGGMCLATACALEGTIAPFVPSGQVRIGNPSGVLPISIEMRRGGSPDVQSVTCYRTQRCLMMGSLPVPEYMMEQEHD